MATAKQLAARRKFARIMKSGGFKKKKTKSGKAADLRKIKRNQLKKMVLKKRNQQNQNENRKQ
jgi:hypothetical protein